jgi:hypothetical protein
VIFTGRLKTLEFLKDNLPQDLGIDKKAISALDGGMADIDQLRIVEAFGKEQDPTRILIATEVASEGLNLHYLSHKLIHFDIPWSLMTLQQRNGRIDRYGQTRSPEIRYLLTRSQVAGMDEVERIIKVLLRKDEQAMLNIGDPSVFMGVFDAEAEEQLTENAIANGMKSTEFEQMLDNNAQGKGEVDIWSLEFLLGETDTEAPTPAEPTLKAELAQFPSLFASDFDYAVTSLQNLAHVPPNLNINNRDRLIELQFPKELEPRYKRLPKEIRRNEQDLMQLCDRPERIMQEMEKARRQENTWARVEYLWELHPLMEWLNDRNLFRYGRQEAPAIALSEGLNPQEAVFIFFASFPNQWGAPILTRWVSVCFQKGRYAHIETLATTLERTQLNKQTLPNRGNVNPEPLMALRSVAVEQAKIYLRQERQQFQAQLIPQLDEQLDRLKALQSKHQAQLELDLQGSQQSTTKQEQQRKLKGDRIKRAFTEHRSWVRFSMTMEAEPFIKLVTVLLHDP